MMDQVALVSKLWDGKSFRGHGEYDGFARRFVYILNNWILKGFIGLSRQVVLITIWSS